MSQMNSPLRGNAPAIALICLLVLVLSLFAPTGLEWTAGIVGLLCAVFFWIDCQVWLDGVLE